MQKRAVHLLYLINDILDLSKVESGRLEIQIEPVRMTEVRQSSMIFVRDQSLKKSLRLGIELSDPEVIGAAASPSNPTPMTTAVRVGDCPRS